jgi:hypothetical protein
MSPLKSSNFKNQALIATLMIFDLALIVLCFFISSEIQTSIMGGVLVNNSKSLFYQSIFILQIPFILLISHVLRSEKFKGTDQDLDSAVETLHVDSRGEREFNLLLRVLITLSFLKLSWLTITHIINYGLLASAKILTIDFCLILTMAFYLVLKRNNRTNFNVSPLIVLVPLCSFLFFQQYSQNLAKNSALICVFIQVGIIFFWRFHHKFRDSSTFPGVFIISSWVLLLTSKSYGPINLHAFESASFSNAQLMLKGQLPYRDFQLEHGLWQDALINFLGAKVAGGSYYQMQLGYSSIIHPLELIIFLVPIYLLTKRLTPVILLTIIFEYAPQIFGLGGQIWQSNLLLIPISILFLRKLLTRTGGKWLPPLSGALFGVSFILNFEFIYFLLGGFLEFLILLRGKATRNRVLKEFALVTIGFLGVIILSLQSFGLLRDFIKSFNTTSSGFFFAWGNSFNPALGFTYYIFNLLVAGSFIYLIYLQYHRYHNHHNLSETSALLAPLLIAIGVYLKYLQWPDWHLIFPIAILFIIFSVLIIPKVRYRELSHQPYAFTLSIFAGIALLITNVSAPIVQMENSSSQIAGPANATTTSYINRVQAVKETFSQYLTDETKIFDFGNEPVTWYGINNYNSIGISKVLNFPAIESQQIVIQALRENPNTRIIWGGEYGYFQWPFNGNWISKYLISEYILKNYSPIAQTGEYFLLERSAMLSNIELPKMQDFRDRDCNYGFSAPRFLFPDRDRNQVVPQSLLENGGSISGKEMEYSHIVIKPSHSGLIVFKDLTGNSIIFYADSARYNRVFIGGCPAIYHQPKGNTWTLQSDGNIKISIF